MPVTFARPELIASPDWLAEHLGRPGVRIVDCRYRVDGTGRQVHAAGHIPGAAYLDWATELVDPDDPLPFQLAGPEAFAAAAGRAGIGDGTTAVLYDDTTSLYAARVWWSLRCYGFDGVRILDGGWPAWLASGRPTSSAVARIEPSVLTPRGVPRLRLATADVNALLGSQGVELVDTRAPAEYHGQEGNAKRLGHIPGAINVPSALLTVHGSGVFLAPDRLSALFTEAGVRRDRRIVLYDGAGIGAAKAAFALTVLGYENVALYEGGWSAWGGRLDLPVDR
ncbi:MAG TPA: rhodanese-like domain-containing protein [Candidatus Limnocylindrales bacterium]